MRPELAVRAQAAAWLAKLHGSERTDQLEADFRSWLAQNPAHGQAFEQITETWDSINARAAAGLPRMNLPLHEAERVQWRGRPRLAAAVLSVLMAVGVGFYFHVPQRLMGGVYTTDVGEQRKLTLADGSKLTLNSDSQVSTDFTSTQRLLTVARGEAYFEVAKDSRRPFKVKAGGQTVTALGTAFDVRHDAEVTVITLLEGKISVDAANETRSVARSDEEARVSTGKGLENETQAGSKIASVGPIVLRAGQRLTFSAAEAPQLDTPKVETATAWRRGEVVLDETPLSTAAAEMNRYERRRIAVDDGAVGALSISGIYRTGDSEGFARAVAAAYELEVTFHDDAIHIHR